MDEDEPDLARAARDGDREALHELLRQYVPLVHDLVARAVGHPGDAAEVTRQVAVRVAADLPDLERPGRFRSWLMTIALHEIADHFRRRGTELADQPEPGDSTTDLDQTGQPRPWLDLEQAGRWLDQEYRNLLALWWQECAGRVTRAQIADALELGEAQTALRLQRMREQLEQCRPAVAALRRRPRCAGLDEACSGWPGFADPRWREQITQHVRTCVICLRQAQDQPSAARLIAGSAPLPVPAELIGALVDLDLLDPSEDPRVPADLDWPEYVEDTSAWGRVRWVGRVVTVTSIATLLMFVVGLLYDVSQTPQPRSETPGDTTALSAALAQSAECPDSTLADRARAAWTMPNSADGLPDQQQYTVNADGTVLDEVTCLTWEEDQASTRYTWKQAKKYCAGIDLGDGDWQLPTRIELTSLIDTTTSGPTIDSEVFPDTDAALFWTSSTRADSTDQSWSVDFTDGTTGSTEQSTKAAVRCVQSSKGSGTVELTVTGTQVSDPLTGLVWQRGTSDRMSADEAQQYCTDLDLGGRQWRLPSIQELATLVDESRTAPATDTGAFPETPARGRFWSANRDTGQSDTYWVLEADDGSTRVRSTGSGTVRCVRSS